MNLKPSDFILITGASSGIGKALSNQLMGYGCKLALVSRRPNLDFADNTQVAHFAFDLTELEKISELAKKIISWGKGEQPNIIINCAGCATLGYCEEVPLNEYESSLRLNTLAPIGLIQAFLPNMKTKRSGKIVNVVSGVAIQGLPGVSPYCLSKAALLSFSESLRLEVKEFNISVLTFSPGPTETAFYKNQKLFGKLKSSFVQSSRQQPEQIAAKLLNSMCKDKRHIELALTSRVVYHLKYWAPKLLDWLLCRK